MIAERRFSRALYLWVIALLAVIGAARIVATYPVLVQTIDEANHLAYGMEWLARGTYNGEPHHPPLRAVYALGPYLLGARPSDEPRPHVDGTRMLYEGGHYFRNLGAARAGALPFFVLMCAMLAALASRLHGRVVAVTAVALATTLPVLLAHAGLVTNDFLLTATFVTALWAWLRWLDSPTRGSSLLLGAAIGLAVLAKLSALLFLPVVFLATGALRLALPGPRAASPAMAAKRPSASGVALGVLSAALVIWVGYRFSIGSLVSVAARPHEAIDRTALGQIPWLRAVIYSIVEMPIPAPELLRGITSVWGHGTGSGGGHLSYFMGEVAAHGWRLFFPVAILVKSTLPLLILYAVGLAVAARRSWLTRSWHEAAVEVAALALLAICIPASLNIGVRHILPIFPLMAITAARGACFLWHALPRRRVGAAAVALLLAWQAVASVRAHPDYLGYFNECCSRHPERVLVGSDLDWGQDLQQLSDELRRRGIGQVHLAYSGFADPARHGLPPFDLLRPGVPVKGWVAISVQLMTFGTKEPPYDQYHWLLGTRPVTRVGSSIDLYFVP